MTSKEDRFVETLVKISNQIRSTGYQFRTITPNSHARILERYAKYPEPKETLEKLRWFFGWNVSVGRSLLEMWIKPSLLSDMDSVQLLKNVDGKASFVQADDDDMTQTTKSKIRFSTHDNLLWAHSSFPTTESDCIFFRT